MFPGYSKRPLPSLTGPLGAVLALLPAGEAAAQGHPSAYWNGTVTSWAAGGGHAAFNKDAMGGTAITAAPDATTNVFFSTQAPFPSHTVTTLDGLWRVNSLTFRAGGGAVGIASGTGGTASDLTLMAAGANGITVEAGAAAVTIGAPIVLGSTQSWVNHSGSELTVNGGISGEQGLTLASTGGGGMTLGGPNTYTGATILSAGRLTIGPGGGIAASGGITILPGATLEVARPTTMMRNLNGFGGQVELHGNALTVENSVATEFNGTIQGTDASRLIKSGAGTLTLKGAQTYQGLTAVTNGTLVMGSDTMAGSIHSWVTVHASAGVTAVLEVRAKGMVIGTAGKDGTAVLAAAAGNAGVTVGDSNPGMGNASVSSYGEIKGGEAGVQHYQGPVADGRNGGAGAELRSGSNTFFAGEVKGGSAGLGILTAAGVAGNGGVGGAGIVQGGGSTLSAAAIHGGPGGGSSVRGNGGAGGAGVELDGGSMTSNGSITGGLGGSGGNFNVTTVGHGGAGGAGMVSRTTGTVMLSGPITGGTGGVGGAHAGGTGGAGGAGGMGVLVTAAGGTYSSAAHITGGAAGAGGTGSSQGVAGTAGVGLSFTAGGSFTNLAGGTITGGSPTVSAVTFSGGAGGLTNLGTITGNVSFAEAATLSNSGTLQGAVSFAEAAAFTNTGQQTGAVVFLKEAVFTNAGTLTGDVLMKNVENHATLTAGGSLHGNLSMGTNVASTLTLDGAGTQNWSAAVTGYTTFTGTLVKMGGGTWTIDRPMTHTGATTVSAGKLSVGAGGRLNSTTAITVNGGTFNYASAEILNRQVTVNGGGTFTYNSATAFAGLLHLNNGATLGGGGNLGNTPLTVGAGTILSPGNSPGNLTTGSETWLNGGNYHWQLHDAAGTAGTGYDLLTIHGTLDLTKLAAGGFLIDLWTLSGTAPEADGPAVNFNPELNYSWTIVSTSDGIVGFKAANFTIHPEVHNGAGGFRNPVHGTFSMRQAGNNLVLDYTAVPEPAALVLVALGPLVWLRRRR